MELDHVELHQLRGHLLMRPLDANAIRCANALARDGIAEATDATSARTLQSLADVGLAWCTARDAQFGASYVPTPLLSALYLQNRMGELEPRR